MRFSNMLPSLGQTGTPMLMLLLVLLAVLAMLLLIVLIQYSSLYLLARSVGVPVGFIQMIVMRFRRLDPNRVVRALVRAHNAGLDVSLAMIEAHEQAGGDARAVVTALARARNHQLPWTWDQAAALDQAGVDPGEAVDRALREKLAPEQFPQHRDSHVANA